MVRVGVLPGKNPDARFHPVDLVELVKREDFRIEGVVLEKKISWTQNQIWGNRQGCASSIPK